MGMTTLSIPAAEARPGDQIEDPGWKMEAWRWHAIVKTAHVVADGTIRLTTEWFSVVCGPAEMIEVRRDNRRIAGLRSKA